MTAPSSGKKQTLLGVVALLGAIASILTALLGPDGLSSVLPFLAGNTDTTTSTESPASSVDLPDINQGVSGGSQGCVVGNVGPNSTVTCENKPQPPPTTVLPVQPPLLVPGQSLEWPELPEGFGSLPETSTLEEVDTSPPPSWCLALKEQWSVRKEMGNDSASILASFDEANCSSHGIEIP
jgi:hypothetical protein